MEKHVLLDSPEEDGHNDWALEDVSVHEPVSADSPRRRLVGDTSPRPARIFKGNDSQQEAWTRWEFLQHMPDYLALMLEQKEYREVISKAQEAQLLSARRQVMASDLAILLRVLPMFTDNDEKNIADEFALAMAGEIRSNRPTRSTQLPTVQRRASKLASLPAVLAIESMAARRASVEHMTDSIVEAIRQASGKAKGGRTASKGRPNAKGRRQSVGQERARHSTAHSNFLDARRNSLGSEAPDEDAAESLDSVSLEVLLDVLPTATKVRWSSILKLADAELESSKQRFVAKIAKALRQKPQWFIVHESLGSGVTAELVEPQPLNSPLPPSAEDVPQHCHCWLGSLMVIHRLAEVADNLSEVWQFQVSLERLESVAASVERAESLSLCGGFALTLDVCQGGKGEDVWSRLAA